MLPYWLVDSHFDVLVPTNSLSPLLPTTVPSCLSGTTSDAPPVSGDGAGVGKVGGDRGTIPKR